MFKYAKRKCLIIILLVIGMFILNVTLKYSNWGTIIYTVLASEKDERYTVPSCKDWFYKDRMKSIKDLLNVSTNAKVEGYLKELGFPNRLDDNGDVYLPKFSVKKTLPLPTIVTAASADHMNEMEALLYSIDTNIRNVYPKIKVIVYDIGLTEDDVERIRLYGKCEYRKFNFTKYPQHLRQLKPCGWKPVMLQEVLNDYEFGIWMDTSIRMNHSKFTQLVEETKKYGHVFISTTTLAEPGHASPLFVVNNTYAESFKYFNKKPCLFLGVYEVGGGFIPIIKNNLNSYAIMRSWLTCVFQEKCLHGGGSSRPTECNGRKFHKCHRFDQSILGIATTFIYHTTDNLPRIPRYTYSIQREDKCIYFPPSSQTAKLNPRSCVA